MLFTTVFILKMFSIVTACLAAHPLQPIAGANIAAVNVDGRPHPDGERLTLTITIAASTKPGAAECIKQGLLNP